MAIREQLSDGLRDLYGHLYGLAVFYGKYESNHCLTKPLNSGLADSLTYPVLLECKLFISRNAKI
jgi:hypothetical protein